MSFHSAEISRLTKVTGTHYIDVLANLHAAMQPDWYLEIGSQTGRSLALSSARSVAVDPKFVIKTDIVGAKPELHLSQSTSDAFFASGMVPRLGARFDLAFIDGMHLFDYVLRDFANTEAAMQPGGAIVLHDCLPWSEAMAARDRRQAPSRAWTGDVWKMVPILREWRPDLDVRVYDAAPTGVVIVRGLNPDDTTLRDHHAEIVAEWTSRDDVEAQVSAFEVHTAAHAADDPDGQPRAFRGLDLPPIPAVPAGPLQVAIKIPAPNGRAAPRWGDTHFAEGLAGALRREGHGASVLPQSEWATATDPNGVDLVLRGRQSWDAPAEPGRLQLAWFISGAPDASIDELRCLHHVFAASKPLCDAIARQVEPERLALLPQAFDAAVMTPPAPDAPRDGVVFVGIARNGATRPIVDLALQNQAPLRLWGPGWDQTEAAPHLVDDRHDNAALAETYGSAEIVLNDHRQWMRQMGLTSNRIFDALACGAPVISDAVRWLPDDIAPFVHCVSDATGFAEAVAAIRAESPARRAERHAFALTMRETHSFDARARQILAAIGRPPN